MPDFGLIELALSWAEINNVEPPLELQVKCALAIKSLPYFRKTIERLVKSLYDGFIGGEFVDTMKNLISGQMRKAYAEAWKEDGNEGKLPDELEKSAQALADEQAGFVDGYYKAIVDARVNKTSAEPLMYRAELWANRYTQAKNDAFAEIAAANGGKLVWIEGDTEDKCDTCVALDGITAYATEWAQAGFKPQNAPNAMIDCGGWNCQCKLEPTDKRRSPKALDTLMNIATSRGM
jgi:hypothetical protein